MAVLWVILIAGILLLLGSWFAAVGLASDEPSADRSESQKWQDRGAMLTFSGAAVSVVGSAGAMLVSVTNAELDGALFAFFLGVVAFIGVLGGRTMTIDRQRAKKAADNATNEELDDATDVADSQPSSNG